MRETGAKQLWLRTARAASGICRAGVERGHSSPAIFSYNPPLIAKWTVTCRRNNPRLHLLLNR